jgi:hypothetical protein
MTAAGMIVDIHKTGAYKLTFRIDHFTAGRDREYSGLTKVKDLAVFNEKSGIRD